MSASAFIEDGWDDANLVYEMSERLAKNLTDPAEVTYEGAHHLIRRLPKRVLANYAAREILGVARAIVRRRVREIEQAAMAAQPKEPTVPTDRWGKPLYLGKYRHGSMDKQKGAVLRGCDCAECCEVREWEREADERYHREMNKILAAYRADLRMEWTQELLGASFAINTQGDTVTWAEATVEDHRACVTMLEGNMVALGMNAARHLQAVSEIETAGVNTLGELVESLTGEKVET